MSSFNLQEQPQKRSEAIEKLLKAMVYEGMHSILLLGDRGVGKTHWIHEIVENTKYEYFQKGFIPVYTSLCEESREFWEEKMIEANGKLMVVEEVEHLSKKNQDLFFEALSTTDGSYGFSEKKYRFVLVFTSSHPIEKLRDDRRLLSAKFFDRISQFVVEFPNFSITQRHIFNDFRATWEKMKFKEDCPNSKELIKWLEQEAYRMYGNFRDLDKIAVNWNLHQKANSDEEKILPIIKDEFEKYLHHPNQKYIEDNIFSFNEDMPYHELMSEFKSKLKKWTLLLNNNDIKKAAEQLQISHRTMERW